MRSVDGRVRATTLANPHYPLATDAVRRRDRGEQGHLDRLSHDVHHISGVLMHTVDLGHLMALDVDPCSEDLLRVSVTEAKGQLTGLARLAEAGDEVILTRHAQDQYAVHLMPARVPGDRKSRPALLEAVRRAGPTRGPSAAPGQDFLCGDDGLPKRLRSISRRGWRSCLANKQPPPA